MKDGYGKRPRKHLFAFPENFSALSDQEIDEFAAQLHGRIIQTLREDQMTPLRIAILGSSFVGLIEGQEKLAAVAKFMQERLAAGKVKCKTSWCLACMSKPLDLDGNPLDHVVQISLPTILELMKIIQIQWQWAEPEGEWALSHGKAHDHFNELVERKSRPNFVIRPVANPSSKVGQK